ncbi:MAG: ribose-phosphate pyrophosphokinase [Gammaproteobacteria bacterium TMED222]|jgi:ribose-phosphate pyrophosphokinase|nr:MAG: ribose-phosphate pyrophosphokinase [Gammaproteobacteria bacterium TMED222]RZO97650.1 MAG: ribose-phosphate pyrophosphokinase [Gammaproteobacteria bacterium]
MNDNNLVLFSGNSNLELASKVAKKLNISLGKALVDKFSDNELNIRVDEHVRGKDVFILQSTCFPANDNLMELIILIDALRRSSASRITAVIPYFGYARQDRRVRSERVPISAKLVADMLQSAGADRILTIELHSDQIQGFFNVPVDNVYGTKVLHNHIVKSSYKNQIIVSPDVGGVVRARALAKLLDDADLAIIDKRREKENSSQVMNVIGDVKGKTCILVDDIIDTAGTICNAADALKEGGANKVVSYATHAVLSGPAIERISNSKLDELIVTDTIPLSEKASKLDKIKIISMDDTLSEAINRVNKEESISAMFL